MPSIEVATHGIQAVADIGVVLVDLLRHAESVKLTAAIEPPLEKSDFGDLHGHLMRVLPPLESDSPLSMRTRQYGIIETAVRDIFGKLVVCPPGFQELAASYVGCAGTYPLLTPSIPQIGDHIHRITRVRQGLESAGSRVDPFRYAPVRSRVAFLACRGTPR